MDKSIAERWATALESGEYVQGRGELRSDQYFCCLGVLCELATADGVAIERADDGHGYRAAIGFLNGMPPEEVYTWCGLDGALADLYADMNDSDESFEEIAKRIREDNGL